MDIGADAIDIGTGGEDGGESVEDEAGVVEGYLEGIGEGGFGNSARELLLEGG